MFCKSFYFIYFQLIGNLQRKLKYMLFIIEKSTQIQYKVLGFIQIQIKKIPYESFKNDFD
jgi:hypothetical protein